MSRKRLSWKNRKADPYTMNQDRNLPPVEKYQIGDPSEWAEDVHSPLPDDAALGRNEVGMPNMPASNMNHKNVEEWGDDGAAYDNMGGGSVTASRRREAARDVYARLEKKAYQCVKIAEALLPGAPEALIEEQAFDFMSLPDATVVATALRIAADDEEEKDEEEEEEESEEEEEEDDDKEEDKGSDKEASLDDDVVEAMLREMIAEEEAKEEEEGDDEKEAMMDEAMEDMDEAMMDEDPEVAAMIREMQDDTDMDMDAMEDMESMEMDVEMDPMMDVMSSEIEDDDVLRNLFSNTLPEGLSETSTTSEKKASRGVQSLGGRVKEAADTEGGSDLSKLWQSDPDVSDVF